MINQQGSGKVEIVDDWNGTMNLRAIRDVAPLSVMWPGHVAFESLETR